MAPNFHLANVGRKAASMDAAHTALMLACRRALDAGQLPSEVAAAAGFGSVSTMYRWLADAGLSHGRWGHGR